MEYFFKNTKLIREKAGLTQSQMADLFGIKGSTWGNYESAVSKPNLDILIQISKKFGISESDLLNKDLSNVDLNQKKVTIKKNKNVNLNVDLSVDLNQEKAPNIEASKPSKSIPLIPIDAVAGYGNGDFSVSQNDISKHYVVPDFIDVKADFIITAKGSSMLPKYSSGDKLACRIIRDYQFIQWGKVYVLDTDQGALVKRLYQGSNDDTITCHSDNDGRYPRFEIPKTSIRSLAIVVGVIRLE